MSNTGPTAVGAAFLGDTLLELLELNTPCVILAPNLRADWTAGAVDALRGGLARLGDIWLRQFRQGRALRVEPLSSKIVSYLQGAKACPGRCRMALDDIVVAPSGHLYPCGELVSDDLDPTHRIGTVRLGIDMAKVEALRRQRLQINAECEGCALLTRCDNYCGCKHVALTGRLGAMTPTLCAMEDAFVEVADRVAEALWAEKNELFLDEYYRTAWNLIPGAALLGKTPR